MRAYSVEAKRYAEAVLSGEVLACQWVRLACQRHILDLLEATDPTSRYYFDEGEADRACGFMEHLPHVKGRWAAKRELLHLQAWQCFIVCCIFGWRRRKDGLRRFRHAYLAIPRKNGKSILAAAIGIYLWGADGEFGAEVYCGATTEKQAWEVFTPARSMIRKSDEIREMMGAEVWAKTLIIPEDSSKFEPVIGNPGDGSSPSCAIIDEFHEHDSPAMVDTMVTGMGAREHPLLLEITTSGFNLASPCYDQEQEAKKVLSGAIYNPELFTIIYTIDEGDDWKDPDSLRKANPNWGVSVGDEFLESQLRLAIQNPINQNKFKTKHLNVWCSARSAWMNLELWNRGAIPGLTREDVAGSPCAVSFDAASKCDLVAESELYARQEPDGKNHYYLFGRYWLPEAVLEGDDRNAHIYRKWATEGHLQVTEGATIDFETVAEEIGEDLLRSGARELVFDPFNGIHLAQRAAASDKLPDDFELVEFNQKPWNFPVPMDEITAALKDGRFHHDGNPITRWCVSNVVARQAKKGMFSPQKENNDSKIDGAVSAIMAVSRLMPREIAEETGSVDGWLQANKS